ncbi:MAG TPA: hypothetical protein VHH57_06765 [Gaiella sp.]|jgi:hypothetical protein|nr:hypothetical protein [Gaiella sp.]
MSFRTENHALLPDVELGGGNWCPVHPVTTTCTPGRLAGRLFGDRFAVAAHRRARHVERPEDGRLGCLIGHRRQRVDEIESPSVSDHEQPAKLATASVVM